MPFTLTIYPWDHKDVWRHALWETVQQAGFQTYELKPGGFGLRASEKDVRLTFRKRASHRGPLLAGTRSGERPSPPYGPQDLCFNPQNFPEFDVRIEELLQRFDWCLLQMSYDYGLGLYHTLVFKHEEDLLQVREVCEGISPTLIVEAYDSPDTSSRDLRNAMMGDPGYAGMVAWEVARVRDEVPYLLCMLDPNEDYGVRDETQDDDLPANPSGTPWYEPYLADVPRLHSADLPEHGGASLTCFIVQQPDAAAYRELWSMAEKDEGIVECAFSAQADLPAIVDAIGRTEGGHLLDVRGQLRDHCDWMYWSDWAGPNERLALFRAEDAKITDAYWRIASASPRAFVQPYVRF